MTDKNTERIHWRCTQCGWTTPINEALCSNPSCRAELGVYGVVVQPEEQEQTVRDSQAEELKPEKKPKNSDKKPEKPPKTSRSEKKKAKAAALREKKEAREARRAQSAASEDICRFPLKVLLPCFAGVYALNELACYLVWRTLGGSYTRWYAICIGFICAAAIGLVLVGVWSKRERGYVQIFKLITIPIIAGLVAFFATGEPFGPEPAIGIGSAVIALACSFISAVSRWLRERRYKSSFALALATAVTFALVVLSLVMPLTMSYNYTFLVGYYSGMVLMNTAAILVITAIEIIVTRRDPMTIYWFLLSLVYLRCISVAT